MDEIWEDPDYRAWEQRVRSVLVPMLEDSSATVSLVPRGETDVKFAVELGLSIMLDKPIIALVSPGSGIPSGLARVASEIVEVDLSGDPDGAQRSIQGALTRVALSRASHISLDDAWDDDED